ncbi:hypothetical protein L1987_29662 [Smallanthus sonchifolius]|uniref:Uncharacterized protein n=1 Tax=Smallanthus sonchifolius TaxID=185202 RepID=A0ACB9I0L2_9ASTR|nr:hypothetical protein L1987_29662 [Smallanthus sonchifolius]
MRGPGSGELGCSSVIKEDRQEPTPSRAAWTTRVRRQRLADHAQWLSGRLRPWGFDGGARRRTTGVVGMTTTITTGTTGLLSRGGDAQGHNEVCSENHRRQSPPMSFTPRSSSSSISPFRSRKSSEPPDTARCTKPHSSKQHISPATPPISSNKLSHRPVSTKVKENATITVRLRSLNSREIGKGDEIAWFADGDYSIQNEFNPAIAYGFG